MSMQDIQHVGYGLDFEHILNTLDSDMQTKLRDVIPDTYGEITGFGDIDIVYPVNGNFTLLFIIFAIIPVRDNWMGEIKVYDKVEANAAIMGAVVDYMQALVDEFGIEEEIYNAVVDNAQDVIANNCGFSSEVGCNWTDCI